MWTTQQAYQAFVAKDSALDGLLFIGVRSTGIFCRPTCPAKKAAPGNCEFFAKAQEALLAGYRACKRCHPMQAPNAPSQPMQVLLAALEADIGRRWSNADVRKLGLDPSTIKRHFQKRFGLSFVAYARSRRLGSAFQSIRSGQKVIAAQIDSGYASGSGFRDAFAKTMGFAPGRKPGRLLLADWLQTPLGAMIAIADDKALHLLEFTDRRGLEKEIESLRKEQAAAIVPGRNPLLRRLGDELEAYFSGELRAFQTPIHFRGSGFQKAVLQSLLNLPYGQVMTYSQQAGQLGKPEAIRAVARANGRNQIAIVIPCHRVLGVNGKLTGYSGGLARKEWLLQKESSQVGKVSFRKKEKP